MCGLFGFMQIGVSNRIQLRSLALHLANASAERGEDATGYATIENTHLIVRKKAQRSALFPPVLIQSKILVGHTRLATRGAPDLDCNAHPFLSRCERYAFCHNGVANTDYERLKPHLVGIKTEVDSEGMLRYLEQFGFSAIGLARFYTDWSRSILAISIL
jgi:glucosamine 6-phosphate synthetase-like amidotransferase/phosphosugar isomerase protein